MSISQHEHDPLATVVDWLDTCRAGDLKTLLEFYDERAIVECGCEAITLTGRLAIRSYWAPKLYMSAPSAFDMNDIELTGDGIKLVYTSFDGEAVQVLFEFNASGKIVRSTCGPISNRK